MELADNLMTELSATTEGWLLGMPDYIGPILIAAFGISVGFVAYKLIKRALNKA